MKESADFKTLCVHAGQLKDEQYGGSISPLYMSSSYAFNDIEINQYPRYFNTPNQRGLAQKIAALEGAEAGMIFGSGMAAISTALLSHLKSGDHVVFQDDLYGGTRNFIKHEFPKYGIQYSFTSGIKASDFENEIKLYYPNHGNMVGGFFQKTVDIFYKLKELNYPCYIFW